MKHYRDQRNFCFYLTDHCYEVTLVMKDYTIPFFGQILVPVSEKNSPSFVLSTAKTITVTN